jgi:hypothetical protein
MAAGMRRFLALILLSSLSTAALALQPTDAQLKSQIIKQSVSSYLDTIGNCPCPYNRDKAGRSCGKRSAWSKAGGNSPTCFSNDVTKEMLEHYKNSTGVSNHDAEVTGSIPPVDGGTEDGGVKIKP